MTEKVLTSVARRLRGRSTEAEALLWSHLRGRQLRGHKFVRQFPIGNAVVDFACRSAKLVIELDGGQHAKMSEGDAARSRMIEAHGYRVICLWNNEAIENPEGVLQTILRELNIATNL